MKPQYKGFEFNQKSMHEEEDYWVVEGIFSTPEEDFGGDIVPVQAVKNSIAANGIPSFRHQHDGLQHPMGKIVEIFYEGQDSKLKAHIPKDPMFSGFIKLIKMGAYKGLSIGYMVNTEKVTWEGNVRVLNEINIFEISLVDSPMNGGTNIQAKNKQETMSMNLSEVKSLSDMESFLTAFVSNSESKTVISKINEFKQRDAEAQVQRDADAKKEKDDEREVMRKEIEEDIAQKAKEKEDAEADVEKERLKKEAEASEEVEAVEKKSKLEAMLLEIKTLTNKDK